MSCRYLRLMCFSWDVTDRFFVWFSKKVEIFLPIRNKDRYSVSFLLYFSLFLCEYNVVPSVGDLSKITRLLRRLGTCNVFSKHTYNVLVVFPFVAVIFTVSLAFSLVDQIHAFRIRNLFKCCFVVTQMWSASAVETRIISWIISYGIWNGISDRNKESNIFTNGYFLCSLAFVFFSCRQSMALCSIQRHL